MDRPSLMYNSAAEFLCRYGKPVLLSYGNRLFISQALEILNYIAIHEGVEPEGLYWLERISEHLRLELRGN